MLSCATQAQTTGWVNGYIITTTNDTVRGQLNNKDWFITPTAVAFKQGDEKAQLYGTEQLSGFFIEPTNELFLRSLIRFDKTPVKLDELSTTNEPVWVTETAFIQVLNRGLLSLATHRDKEGKVHYLVQREVEGWQDLILLRYKSDNTEVTTIERYKQQLGAATFDCPSMANRLPKLAFSQSALQTFVVDYNRCRTGNAGTYQKAVQKDKLAWGILAGGYQTTLNLSIPGDKTFFADQPYHYTGSSRLTAGLWLNYFLLRNKQQWSLYNDLHVQGYSVQGSWSGKTSQLTGEFSYNYVKLYTGFRWQSPAKTELKPFVMAGVSNGIAFSSKQTVFYDHNRTHEQAIFGSVGLRYGNILGEFRYERGNGMAIGGGISTLTQTVLGLVSVAF